MGDTGEEVLAPKWLTIPTVAVANQATTAKTGSIAMSGTSLVFFNGSAWKSVVGS